MKIIKKFIQGDCLIEIPKLRKKFDLFITDPPYNIGWNYSPLINDKKKDYDVWCWAWLKKVISKMKNGATFCIINYPENNNNLYLYITTHYELQFIQQLIWHYNTNIGHSKSKYTRSYRTILVFSKGKQKTFNAGLQPYKNPNDKRIKDRIKKGSKGVNRYDVLYFDLCKNVSKSKKNIGINQLPNGLIDFLIKSYSKENDRILDCFVGNGTVINRAKILKRNSVGIDINNYN